VGKSKSTKAEKIDELMELASAALAKTDYFECEQLALQALNTAYEAGDFERMARITLPLQEARRQKRLEAVDSGEVIRLNEADAEILEAESVEPGCYLFEPLLVGADGRDFRERANQQRIPVLVVVREPRTSLGEWPVVMIGPLTVRTRIQPPGKKDESPVTVQWMQAASEALGDEAIMKVDSTRSAADQVGQILDLLGTCPEHEKLHQALESTCRAAMKEAAAKSAKKAS
jgi:hypothetical protein